MDLKEPLLVSWIAEFIKADVIGDPQAMVTGLNEIHKVTAGDLTFVDFEKYYKKSLTSAASVVIINKAVEVPAGKTLLVCDDPFAAFVSLVKRFRPFSPQREWLHESVGLGEGTVIQPGVFIGEGVTIGDNCIIHSNVTIYDFTEIGDQVIIHAGAVIGADAFYYKRRPAFYDKLESCGKVVIEDNVEIGAGTTIDKGVSGITRIGAGTKIDNHVHIGHGVEVGRNCLIAAQVGIGGKTIIEDEVVLWGQVGVSKDLRIGKGAVVYAQSGVASSIEGNKVYFGSPVEEARTKMREQQWVKRIPEIWSLLTRRSPPDRADGK